MSYQCSLPKPAILNITVFSHSRDLSEASDTLPALLEALRGPLEAEYNHLAKLLRIDNRCVHITYSNQRIIQYRYLVRGCLPNFASLRHEQSIKHFEEEHGVEILFDPRQDVEPSAVYCRRRPLRLALFDMDSTLINEEVIDELARSIDKTDLVSTITLRAMNGEIDFETSLRERVAMLKGARTSVWEDLKRTVTIATGARELIQELKKAGVITGVISGGFAPMAEWLKGELGLDYAFANHLLTSPPAPNLPYPHLTGTLSPDHPIVTPERKRDTLVSLANEHNIPAIETLAVGDGSNDLLMLHAAGLGIAYNAKQRVQEKAPLRLNTKTLADLLYVVGLKDPDP